MGSRKPAAKAKRIAQFRAELGGGNEAFSRESKRAKKRAEQAEAALRTKACASKNRYSCRSDALAAIAECADHGTTGLSCYRCPYCNGWHLTSKSV